MYAYMYMDVWYIEVVVVCGCIYSSLLTCLSSLHLLLLSSFVCPLLYRNNNHFTYTVTQSTVYRFWWTEKLLILTLRLLMLIIKVTFLISIMIIVCSELQLPVFVCSCTWSLIISHILWPNDIWENLKKVCWVDIRTLSSIGCHSFISSVKLVFLYFICNFTF